MVDTHSPSPARLHSSPRFHLSPGSLCNPTPPIPNLQGPTLGRPDSLRSVRTAIIRTKQVACSTGKLNLLATAASAGVHLAEAVLCLGDCVRHDVVRKIEAVDMIVVDGEARKGDAVIFLELLLACKGVPEGPFLCRCPHGEEESKSPRSRSHFFPG